jgi:hypothetical protein
MLMARSPSRIGNRPGEFTQRPRNDLVLVPKAHVQTAMPQSAYRAAPFNTHHVEQPLQPKTKSQDGISAALQRRKT